MHPLLARYRPGVRKTATNYFKRTAILILLSSCLALAACGAAEVRLPAAPSPTPEIREAKVAKVEEDPYEQFRVVPPVFADLDFDNHSYGRYTFWSGKTIWLALTRGEYRYDNPNSDRGWFALKDVYYSDVTGDGTPEAIVLLNHVQCGGGSCDGGSSFIHLYTIRKGKPRRLWQYETGSGAYGCSLKSLTLRAGQIVLEVFGRCTRPATDNPGPRKFMVKDLTRLVFRFNGRRFVRNRLQFIPAPLTDVGNYKATISIA